MKLIVPSWWVTLFIVDGQIYKSMEKRWWTWTNKKYQKQLLTICIHLCLVCNMHILVFNSQYAYFSFEIIKINTSTIQLTKPHKIPTKYIKTMSFRYDWGHYKLEFIYKLQKYVIYRWIINLIGKGHQSWSYLFLKQF